MADLDITTTTTPDSAPPAAPDPSLPEVDVNAQRPQAPSISDLESQITAQVAESLQTPSQEPQARQLDALAEQHRQREAQWAQQEAKFSEQMAAWTEKVGPEMANYIQQTPTRQGIYASTMHITPILSVLAAIGGKATRASGLQMLAAQSGIVQGMNQGNEQAYQDAMERYKTGYTAFAKQVEMQEKYYTLMLKAYGQRTDAEEKAAIAAEKMAGNIRTAEQRKLGSAVSLLNAELRAKTSLAQLANSTAGLELRRQHEALEREKFEYAKTQKAQKQKDMQGREAVYFGRMVTSANQAIKDTANMMEMPITIHSPVLGTGHYGSILEAPKAALANEVTTQDVQIYGAVATGIQRALANIEANGLAPQGSLTSQMESVIIRPGDTNLTKLSRMAEIRQIIEGGLEPSLVNPRVPDEQKQYVQQLLDKVKRVVPFTQHDVIQLEMSDNPNATIMAEAGQRGLGDAPTGGYAGGRASTAAPPAAAPQAPQRDTRQPLGSRQNPRGDPGADPSQWIDQQYYQLPGGLYKFNKNAPEGKEFEPVQ